MLVLKKLKENIIKTNMILHTYRLGKTCYTMGSKQNIQSLETFLEHLVEQLNIFFLRYLDWDIEIKFIMVETIQCKMI